MWKALKVWQGYPALIGGALVPWLSPFLAIDMINTRWRPSIDYIANVVIAFAILGLMAKKKGGTLAGPWGSRLGWSVGLAFVLGLGCYATQKYLIHFVDPEFLWLANIPWAISYVLAFLFLACAIFFLMCMFDGE